MATIVKGKRALGPNDHGRAMTLEEFLAAEAREGYKYELVDGRLYVSPEANLPENRVEVWLFRKLDRYSSEHLEIVNYVTTKARVFVPGRPGITNPEPDLALYRDFPLHLPFAAARWQDVFPLLVVEVLAGDDSDKDLVRNVELYLQVPAIKEYWIIDIREDPERPTLIVHRRQGNRWRVITVGFGGTYKTPRLLPGFELVVDPRK